MNVKHLGKYLAASREKYNRMALGMGLTGAQREAIVSQLIQRELEAGVQTIQYQINTLMTTNGR